MAELQSKILEYCHAERARWILWVPVLIGCGVGLYFALPSEPSLTWLMASSIVGVPLLFVVRRHFWGFAVLLMCWLVLLGVTLGATRTAHVAAPILQKDVFGREVTGVVSEITIRPDDVRLTLIAPQIERIKVENTPVKVTVTLRNSLPDSLALGDKVRLKAGFFPPPPPVIPHGYAFNRHFYFERIGAMGYAVGNAPLEIIGKAEARGGFSESIDALRHHIATWLMREMGAREGAIAAALTVGEAKAIPEDIYEAMRQSGLVHVLSISGMHLSLAAGILFFSARLLFAAIPAFSNRFDGKKVAALFALVSSFIYLLLAGMPISAQRAFVMVALVLLAVMLSRNVTPMRSLVLAALVILTLAPESLLNPGFQLSFAATMGILGYYEHWREKRSRMLEAMEWTWQRRWWNFWSGIILTSVIATATTVPYILHHFEDLPTYSVLGNLLVMPLVSFAIMPLVILVLLLLPFGLAGLIAPLLKYSLLAMHSLAAWVSSLPFAVITLPPLPAWALCVITLGGLWLLLWQQKWRHFGWLAIVAGFVPLAFYQAPDVIISGDGKKIAIRTEQGAAMLRGARSGFTQDGWLRFMQVDAFGLRSRVPDSTLRCDDAGCIYRFADKLIAVVEERSALAEDCNRADLTLTPYWSSYRDVKRLCPQAMLFDRRWLEKSGTMVFWLKDDIRYETVWKVQGNRPWVVRRD